MKSIRTSRLATSHIAMASTALALAWSAPAFGQVDAPDQARRQTDQSDIIVTARRVEERLLDVPASITVYNQEALDKRNLVTGQDLAAYTPSLEVSTQQGSTNTSFTLRGFVQDQGTAPTVGAYFADAVALRGGSNTLFAGDGLAAGAFFDLQNVQVLKGPQGTLFGRNTTGGAVLVVPRKPTGEFEGYVEGSLGNYDMMRLQAVVNVPLADWARLRLGVDRQKRDGYVKNTGGVGPERFSDVDYWSLRGSLVLDLSPDLENYTVVTYNRSNVVGDVQSLFGCYPGTRFTPLSCAQETTRLARGDGFWTAQTSLPDVFSDTKQWQAINRLTWKASDNLTVTNITSYGAVTQEYANPLFGTLWDASILNPALPKPTYIDFSGVQALPGNHFIDQWTGSNELRVAGNSFGGAFEWQGGIYLEKSAPRSTAGSNSSGFVSCVDLEAQRCTNPPLLFIPAFNTFIGIGTLTQSLQRNTYKNAGVYFQGTYALTDQLKLTGGIRYTWDKVDSQAFNIQYNFPTSLTPVTPSGSVCRDARLSLPCEVAAVSKTNAPTWLIGLDYKPTNDILLFAKYARGYRGGGVNPTLPQPINVFAAEKIDSYEAGLKASFRGPIRGSFSIVGFYNNLTNQQLKLSFINVNNSAQFLSGAVNAGRTEIYGFEIETTLQPFEGFTLEGGYSFLAGGIREANAASVIPPPSEIGYIAVGGPQVGDPASFAPRHKLTATGTFTIPLEGDSSFSLGGTVTYTAKQVDSYALHTAPGVLSPDAFIPARTLVNLNASWNSVAGTPLDLSLFVTNLFNKEYVTFRQILSVSIGADSRQLGQPRMIGVRVRYRFGE